MKTATMDTKKNECARESSDCVSGKSRKCDHAEVETSTQLVSASTKTLSDSKRTKTSNHVTGKACAKDDVKDAAKNSSTASGVSPSYPYPHHHHNWWMSHHHYYQYHHHPRHHHPHYPHGPHQAPVPPAPQSTNPYPMSVADSGHAPIWKPGPRDICCSPGGVHNWNNNPGNIQFLLLIGANRTNYTTLSKKQKSAVVRKLVDYVTKSGGKFLAKDASMGESCWYDIRSARSIEETSLAILKMPEKPSISRSKTLTRQKSNSSDSRNSSEDDTSSISSSSISSNASNENDALASPTFVIPESSKEYYKTIPVVPPPSQPYLPTVPYNAASYYHHYPYGHHHNPYPHPHHYDYSRAVPSYTATPAMTQPPAKRARTENDSTLKTAETCAPSSSVPSKASAEQLQTQTTVKAISSNASLTQAQVTVPLKSGTSIKGAVLVSNSSVADTKPPSKAGHTQENKRLVDPVGVGSTKLLEEKKEEEEFSGQQILPKFDAMDGMNCGLVALSTAAFMRLCDRTPNKV